MPVNLTEDGGVMTIFNQSVTASPADGTEEGAAILVDSNTVFKATGDADSAGAVDNIGIRRKVRIHTESADAQTWTLDEMLNPVITNLSWDGADDLNINASAITGNLSFTYIVHEPETATATININPDDAHIVVLDGTALDAGDSVEIVDPSRGAQIDITTIDDGGTIYIYIVTRVGTWVDGS
jgi:hypothetical protein